MTLEKLLDAFVMGVGFGLGSFAFLALRRALHRGLKNKPPAPPKS